MLSQSNNAVGMCVPCWGGGSGGMLPQEHFEPEESNEALCTVGLHLTVLFEAVKWMFTVLTFIVARHFVEKL